MTVMAHTEAVEYDYSDGRPIMWDFEIVFILGLWNAGDPYPPMLYPCWVEEAVTDLEDNGKSGLFL